MIACMYYIVSVVCVHRTLVTLSTFVYTPYRKLKSVNEKIIMRLLIILAFFIIPFAFASESGLFLLQGIYIKFFLYSFLIQEKVLLKLLSKSVKRT